jgi:hypothetical protein
MSPGRWSLLVLVALIGLGLAWFLKSFELMSRVEFVPPSARAQHDGYLAARRWLAKEKIASHNIDGLEGAIELTPGSLLVLPWRRSEPSEATLARLLAAVAAGADLLVEAKRNERRDALLDALGVQREDDDDASAPGPGDGDWRARTRNHARARLLRIEVDAATTLRARIHGPDRLSREPAPDWQAGGKAGGEILHFRHGRGHVTVATDLSFVRNWGLGRNDHAELFWRLLHVDGAPTDVIFLRDRSVGLAQWLLEHAWRVLAVLAVLIGAWLWALAPRFGPIQPDPELNRRRLLDHLRASGRLLWSSGARNELAKNARACARDRLHAHYPHLRLLDAEQQVGFVQQRCGLSAEQAQAVMSDDTVTSAAPFLTLVRTCRQLHVKLSHSKGGGHDPLYEGE